MASKREVFPDPFSPQITVIPSEKVISFFPWFRNEKRESFDMAKKEPSILF